MNKNIFLILKTYLLVLSIFSIFRIILFLTELEMLDFDQVAVLTVIQSFIMGIRFDIVISGYILFIPAFTLFILEIFQINYSGIRKFFLYWTFILFSVAFMISSGDIPYFNQFFERFSIGAFEWFDNIDFVFSMIIQEPKYYLISIPFIILEVLFFVFLKKIFKKNTSTQKNNTFYNIFISLLFLSVMFIGIRGRIQKKSPIRVGTAYFSDNAFLNKLGLNPVFTFMRSYIDNKDVSRKNVNLMNNELAVEKVQKYLNINEPLFNSPVARIVNSDTVTTSKPNVVIIIMESMSVAKMKRFGNKNDLTPFLDSLSYNSIFFENFYSSGKHTFSGIFSTLFSFPVLYRQHSMKHIRKYDGIAGTLLNNGYTSTYFTTHDSQFDNVEGFLRANDFQNIISQSNYPYSEIKTTLGVPDDYMFSFSIPIINKLANNKQPFFVTFMTASDHGPYYIPDYFKPKTKNIKTQIVEYADWSLKEFINTASKEEWFDNTIFVFVADHGATFNAEYEIALNYFHVPLIIYAPKIIQNNKTYKKTGSQIDIFPTIMSLLNLPYINNTLGVDLLSEDRKYAIINADDKIGIIDTTYLCIMKDNGNKLELYRYRQNDKTDYFEQNKEKAFDMADYAKANLQVTQKMILDNETTLHNKK